MILIVRYQDNLISYVACASLGYIACVLANIAVQWTSSREFRLTRHTAVQLEQQDA
jgi:hypothetical protein